MIIIPTFVYIWGLTLLTLRGLRKWVEMFMNASDDNVEEEMPEYVKHLYS